MLDPIEPGITPDDEQQPSPVDAVDANAVNETSTESITAETVETPSTVEADPEGNSFQVRYGPMSNVDLSLMGSPFSPLGVKGFVPTDGHLDLPSLEVSEYAPVTATYKGYRLAPNEDSKRWAQSLDQSRHLYLTGDALTDAVHRENSQWQQGLTVGTQNLKPDRPKFAENGTNLLVGEEARLRVRALLNNGSHTRIPLWHTGIWVTIKAPTEAALLELEGRIAQEKISLGRMTNGLIFSSTNFFMASLVTDFIINHISETSYQAKPDEDLRSIILQPDYQQLVWGMLCSIYTDGYQYQQPCMVDPSKCIHVETARLNFGKMSFVDDRGFTQWQREHMRKRNHASQSKDDVTRYQSEHKFNTNSVVTLQEGTLKMELRVPTLSEYFTSGAEWVDQIVQAVDHAFSQTLSEDQRDEEITKQSHVTALQQYAHWIRTITLCFPEGDKHVEDRQTIQDVLADVTSDNGVFKNFFEGTSKYINSIVLNVHGIPKYKCPSCGGEPPSEELRKHPLIFPIDLVSTFFTLVDQRLGRMLPRQTR